MYFTTRNLQYPLLQRDISANSASTSIDESNLLSLFPTPIVHMGNAPSPSRVGRYVMGDSVRYRTRPGSYQPTIITTLRSTPVSPTFCKFEINTTSDWVNRII